MMTVERLADRLTGLQGMKLLLGLSGGADSMALCCILMCLRERGHVTFSAIHVNHGLRGDASDGDEQFLRNFCREHDIPLRVERINLPFKASEDAARTARYGAFRREMIRAGADALCLAHHREDQAETLLMHLMRGSGLTGLAGMRVDGQVYGMRVIRPLLDMSREELKAALIAADQPWREDATNQTDMYLRNRVRHELLPLMEQLAPGATERIASAAALLQPEEALLHRMAGKALHGARETWLPLSALEDAPEELRPRILRQWLYHIPLNREHTAALLSLMSAPVGSACNLPGNRQGSRGYKCLHVVGGEETRWPIVPLEGEGTYDLGDVRLTITSGGEGPGDGKHAQEIPRSLLKDCELRTRQMSDIISPFGLGGRMTLQDYFVNRKVDAAFRNRVPLLCRGREVLLAAGVGAGGVPRWSPEEDNLRLTWTGTMPWMDA